MNMKKIVVATGLAGLLAAGSAIAAPAGHHPGIPGSPAHPPVEEIMQGQNAALESILTVKSNQKNAFAAYADAKTKWASRHAQRKAPEAKVFNEQTRLQAKARDMKEKAELLADLAAKRAALWSVLDPQQKLALDGFESRGHHGMRGTEGHPQRDGVHHRTACPCPAGNGPQPTAPHPTVRGGMR